MSSSTPLHEGTPESHLGPNSTPQFTHDGKKYLITHQKARKDMVIEGAQMSNVVYLYKCEDSTLTIRDKVNAITLDSCRRTSVVFQSVVSSVAFVNCASVEMQAMGRVPTVSIDKTDGCHLYLNNEALDVAIITSKSSEMNVLVPGENGDYVEHPIPEQYKTVIVPGKGLVTSVLENS